MVIPSYWTGHKRNGLLACMAQESCLFIQILLVPTNWAFVLFTAEIGYCISKDRCLLLCKLWGPRAKGQTVTARWIMWELHHETDLTQMFMGVRERAHPQWLGGFGSQEGSVLTVLPDSELGPWVWVHHYFFLARPLPQKKLRDFRHDSCPEGHYPEEHCHSSSGFSEQLWASLRCRQGWTWLKVKGRRR